MKGIKSLVFVISISFLALSSASITFASKNKEEKIEAFNVQEDEEIEFDEPEIEEFIDANNQHTQPIIEEKIEPNEVDKSNELGPLKKIREDEKKSPLKTNSLDRKKLVDYAKTFEGNKYLYGGTSPAGFDCSGFTQYVYKNALAKNLLRNSRLQSTQGKDITFDEIQEGDLLFYGNSKRINHVAIYIGDGKVIHSSNERTGVKISPWNYRKPLKIKNMIDN